MKNCVICNTKKSFDKFHNEYRDCKQCNNKRSLKRYHENKGKKRNQQKIYYEKNREKNLPKQNIRYTKFKEILRFYVELEYRLEIMEEKFTINDSENN